jgi:hypothetical protein
VYIQAPHNVLGPLKVQGIVQLQFANALWRKRERERRKSGRTIVLFTVGYSVTGFA